eukprot:NODE_7480_length_1574_cov_385.499654.p6 GENE.NODE_7480_length_1574_cov_385.499654~~NODE_7480_length_1574_cov_385.499654.p6  ORF type:complete len:54 (-),score=0.24 NODE_7480_length_1574_cov_385.499654:984-1145(-)
MTKDVTLTTTCKTAMRTLRALNVSNKDPPRTEAGNNTHARKGIVSIVTKPPER